MKYLLIFLLTLLWLLYRCTANEPAQTTDATQSPQIHEQIPSTNLHGLSVYASFWEISYGDCAEMTQLDSDEILLFINGSVAPPHSAYCIESVPYVSLRSISEMLDIDVSVSLSDDTLTVSSPRDGHYRYISIGDDTYVTTDDAATILQCEICYADADNQNVPSILQSYPHIMLSKYPAEISPQTQEEAADHLREQLICAYEHTYGSFESLSEPPLTYSEKENLRYQISTLTYKTENDRFYVYDCVLPFYVDKYTEDIFVHYVGLDETFSLFDPTSDTALAFPG